MGNEKEWVVGVDFVLCRLPSLHSMAIVHALSIDNDHRLGTGEAGRIPISPVDSPRQGTRVSRKEEEVVVVFTRENRGEFAQHATHGTPMETESLS